MTSATRVKVGSVAPCSSTKTRSGHPDSRRAIPLGARKFADAAFQREFSLSLLVAVLAVLGYSVNDGGAVV